MAMPDGQYGEEGTNAPGETSLADFLDLMTTPGEGQVDAFEMVTAYRGFALERRLPTPPPNSQLYAQLRLSGEVLVRGARNRHWVKGRVLRPHAEQEFSRLLGVAEFVPPSPPPRAVTPYAGHPDRLDRDLSRDAARLGREAMARILGRAIDVLDQGLDDADSRTRLASARTIIDRFVPAAKARETEDEAVAVLPIENRPSVAEIVGLLKNQREKVAKELSVDVSTTGRNLTQGSKLD